MYGNQTVNVKTGGGYVFQSSQQQCGRQAMLQPDC